MDNVTKENIAFGIITLLVVILTIFLVVGEQNTHKTQIQNQHNTSSFNDTNNKTCVWLHFGFNEFILNNNQRNTIDNVVNKVKNTNKTLFITGYCDKFGNTYYNTSLSQLRANAVRNYMITRGVHPMQIWTRGFGTYDARKVSICY